MNVNVGDLFLMTRHIDYGRVLYEVVVKDGDKIEMEVLADRNVGLDYEEGYRMPNARRGTIVKTTVGALEADIAKDPNNFRKIPESQKEDYLRRVIEDQRY